MLTFDPAPKPQTTSGLYLSSHFDYPFLYTLYIGYTAIGYGAKSVKGWVLGCPDLPTVNLIGYNAKNWLQRGVKSVITRIKCIKSVIMRYLQRESIIARISSSPKSRVISDIYCTSTWVYTLTLIHSPGTCKWCSLQVAFHLVCPEEAHSRWDGTQDRARTTLRCRCKRNIVPLESLSS